MLFKDVVGHEELKKRLREEIKSGKVSHAQLFLGQLGHGSFALALAYMQYLMCQNRQPEDSCGTCANCHKVAKAIHPDVHYVFPVVLKEGKTSDEFIDSWRERLTGEPPYFSYSSWIYSISTKARSGLISVHESVKLNQKLSLSSYEGGYKVVLIWKAEEMNVPFANKILKSLEEPSAKTVYILVAENGENMLPTILSRCQAKKVPRVSFAETVAFLGREYGLNSEEAQSLTARYDANLTAILENAEDSSSSDVHREDFIELMRSSYKRNVIEMLKWCDKMGSNAKSRQSAFLLYSIHMFRQSILKNYTDDQLYRVSKEEAEFLKNFARFINGNNIQDFTQEFSQAHYNLERNANPKIVFTELCFQVMRFIHAA